MRKYKPTFGLAVDLDDEKTYQHLPDDLNELDKLMFKEIGYALVYMNYLPDRKDGFDKSCIQRKRVEKLIQTFANGRHTNYQNKLWYKEQIYLFQDETENMC